MSGHTNTSTESASVLSNALKLWAKVLPKKDPAIRAQFHCAQANQLVNTVGEDYSPRSEHSLLQAVAHLSQAGESIKQLELEASEAKKLAELTAERLTVAQNTFQGATTIVDKAQLALKMRKEAQAVMRATVKAQVKAQKIAKKAKAAEEIATQMRESAMAAELEVVRLQKSRDEALARLRSVIASDAINMESQSSFELQADNGEAIKEAQAPIAELIEALSQLQLSSEATAHQNPSVPTVALTPSLSKTRTTKGYGIPPSPKKGKRANAVSSLTP